MADIGNNYVSAIEVILGNIDIWFKFMDVEIVDDYVHISLAHITVYPMGICSFKELDD